MLAESQRISMRFSSRRLLLPLAVRLAHNLISVDRTRICGFRPQMMADALDRHERYARILSTADFMATK